jgi:single-stranded DNA-binding protein
MLQALRYRVAHRRFPPRLLLPTASLTHGEGDVNNIVVWRALGKQVAEHLRRGRLVGVEGPGHAFAGTRHSSAKRRKATEVAADRVRFPDGKPCEEHSDRVFTDEVRAGVPF